MQRVDGADDANGFAAPLPYQSRGLGFSVYGGDFDGEWADLFRLEGAFVVDGD